MGRRETTEQFCDRCRLVKITDGGVAEGDDFYLVTLTSRGPKPMTGTTCGKEVELCQECKDGLLEWWGAIRC